MAPEINYQPARDGYPMAARVWRQTNASVRVILIHGIVSHSGWYLRSCQHLADNAIEVHALDRRGSGLSFRDRGDSPHVDQWIQDFDDYLDGLSCQLPTVVLGVSWGGKLAALLAARQSINRRRNKSALAGVGLICPGIYAYQQVSLTKQWMVRMATWGGLVNQRVPIPLRDPALFTQSSFYKTYIRDDPFTLRKITVRFAVADLELNRLVRACAEQIQIPMFLMLAGQERIVDNDRTRMYWDRVASPQKAIVEYPDAAHTLEFEPDPRKYLHDLHTHIMHLIHT
jgi:alpha-beta hydrolase superfamily lysophospholipase